MGKRHKKIIERAHRAAAGATGVALATTGLSSCNDNGAVDPLPPPLECNTVNTGQSLIPSATVMDSLVTVRIENQLHNGVWSDSLAVTNPVGATVVSVSQPQAFSRDTLVVTLELDPPSGTSASFTLVGQLTGFDDTVCAFSRTYDIAISGGTVTIGLVGGDHLPLLARQRANIKITGRENQTVTVEANTPYLGDAVPEWTTTDGKLVADGRTARWGLPSEPGIHQLELVMDFGDDGFAFDVLTLEVT